jgi:hypothetical protein
LKLVSGAIRTIEISAVSAIAGAAFDSLGAGTTRLLRLERSSYQKKYQKVFGMPNTTMSSCPYFQPW